MIEKSLVEFDYYSEQKLAKVRSQHQIPSLLKACIDSRRIIYTTKEGSKIVGYLIGHNQAEQSFSLDWLYIEPKYRGQGLAKALLEKLEQDLSARGLVKIELISYNAGRYYQRLGYQFVSKIKVDNQLTVEQYQKGIKGESRA